MDALDHVCRLMARWHRQLWVLWLFLLAFVLLLGLFMPLQNDEINWGYANQHAVTDHFKSITLLPQCQEAGQFAKQLPLSWVPHALVTHLFYMQVDSLVWIRLVGMVRFLLFLGLAWFVVRPLAGSIGAPPGQLFLMLLSLLCADNLPLLMQVDRPEQTLFISIALYLACALNAQSIARHPVLRMVVPAAFIFTVLLSQPSHPKAAALAPLMLCCAYGLFEPLLKRRWMLWALLLALLAFALQSAFFWLERYACPNSRVIQGIIAGRSLPWGTLLSSPRTFLMTAMGVLIKAVSYDLTPVVEELNWLPYSMRPLPWALVALATLKHMFIFLLNMGLLLLCLWFVIKTVLVKTGLISTPYTLAESGKTPRFIEVLAACSFVCLLLVMTITGTDRVFYCATLELPFLYIIFLLCAVAAYEQGDMRRLWRGGWILMAVAVFNIAFLGYRYYPFITQPVSGELSKSFPTAGETVAVPIFLSPWAYETQKSEVEKAYAACHLPAVGSAKRLVLDAYTYPVLRHSGEPLSFIYVNNVYYSPFAAKTLFATMREYHSQGIIIACRFAPPSLLPFLGRHGDYCCAAPQSLP